MDNKTPKFIYLSRCTLWDDGLGAGCVLSHGLSLSFTEGEPLKGRLIETLRTFLILLLA